MKTFLSQFHNSKASDVSSLGSISSRNSDWDSSDFSLSSQSNIDDNCKQLWLIRHGERMDEVASEESRKWRFGIEDNRLFDPPLTINGFKQATLRAKILLDELSSIERNKDYPKCIYVSPLERTLGTAFEIAVATKLPLVIVPGLSECAAAVKRGGLIKRKVINNDVDENIKRNSGKDDVDDEHKHNKCDDYELFLNDYGWIGTCNFLTKQQILKQFGQKGVQISFDYRFVDKFKHCVERLMIDSERNTVICVTHREGMKRLDKRLRYAHIPYCAMAKYACVKARKNGLKNVFDYCYFTEDTQNKLN